MDLEHSTQLIELAKQLISYKSISPNQAGCIDFLETFLTNLGFTTTRLDQNHTSNLLAKIGVGPIIAFAGHIDVVPAGNSKEWLSDPFVLVEQDGYLRGRGIADMKGGVAAFLIAISAYLKTTTTLPGSIVVLLTSDEESQALDGTKILVNYLKEQNIDLDYCILAEPSSVERLGDTIKVGRRGSLTGHLTIRGMQGHIAYPDSFINPIHSFALALLELSTKVWDNGNTFFPPTSFQFANLNCGLGVDNVVAGELRASFNFRYNDMHSAESLQKEVQSILQKHRLNYSIDWQISGKPFLTTQGKLLKTAQQIIEDQFGVTPKLKTDGGTSDGRFLIDISRELLELGLCNKTIHQVNESIKTQDLIDLSNVYYKILINIFENN